ncbi:Metallo-beta-lactamase type 2 [Phycisphaerales bacterium]|nr:Metallo-beta-lactamase type 2 [Phycisphaerales bacterium]
MVGLSRREFMSVAAGAAAGLGVFGHRALGRARLEETFFEWREAAPGFWVALGRTGDDMTLIGGNSVLVTGGEGALLIDTKQAALGPALRREVLGKSAKIAKVLNTHHHFDHAGGNAVFSGECPVVAHDSCWNRLKAAREGYFAQLEEKIAALEASSVEGAKQAGADARAFKEGLAKVPANALEPTEHHASDFTLEIAGREVKVYHHGPGHTDNDLVLHFPKENVVVTGDLVFNGLNPYFDASANAVTTGWIRSLRKTKMLCNATTVVVPGHGPVAGVQCIDDQIEYMQLTRKAVAEAMKEGKSREEISKMTLPRYENLGLKAAVPLLWGGIFDELWREQSRPKPEPSAPKPAGA